LPNKGLVASFFSGIKHHVEVTPARTAIDIAPSAKQGRHVVIVHDVVTVGIDDALYENHPAYFSLAPFTSLAAQEGIRPNVNSLVRQSSYISISGTWELGRPLVL